MAISRSRRYLLLLLIAGPAAAEAELSTRGEHGRAQAPARLRPLRRGEVAVSRTGNPYR
jgi:hypothetical protein